MQRAVAEAEGEGAACDCNIVEAIKIAFALSGNKWVEGHISN